MSFKDLFIVNDNKQTEKKKTFDGGTKKFKNSFPTSETEKVDTSTTPKDFFNNPKDVFKPTETLTPNSDVCEPHMDKIMSMYEEGFNKMNQDGYDFFEFFKGVVEADGVDNPTVYKMALSMAKNMGGSVTKESLLNQADYYLKEINTVYEHYVSLGKTKRSNTLTQKENEESTLNSDLIRINNEIARLNLEKGTVQRSLETIDGKYTPQVTDIDCKLLANNLAKETLVNSITSVVNGIKNNI